MDKKGYADGIGHVLLLIFAIVFLIITLVAIAQQEVIDQCEDTCYSKGYEHIDSDQDIDGHPFKFKLINCWCKTSQGEVVNIVEDSNG